MVLNSVPPPHGPKYCTTKLQLHSFLLFYTELQERWGLLQPVAMASPCGHCPICLTGQKGTGHTCTSCLGLQCSCPSCCPGEEWRRIPWGWGVSLGNILPRLRQAEEWSGLLRKVEMALSLWFLSSCISCEFMVQLFAAFMCCLLVAYCLRM